MTLSQRGSFWTAASVAGLALWASGAPTVVYPLYAQEWGLPPAVSTAIFAVYPIVLVPVLIIFGNLSDVIGRRAVILMGLGALGAGSVVFGLAPDLTWVFVGRALMGVGVGLSLSPATAAMVEFGGRDGARRASSATTAATATGLALATLVGGALVQYAPAPMHLSFWVLTAVIVVVAVAAYLLPRHVRDDEPTLAARACPGCRSASVRPSSPAPSASRPPTRWAPSSSPSARRSPATWCAATTPSSTARSSRSRPSRSAWSPCCRGRCGPDWP